jgi:hypothetical protein
MCTASSLYGSIAAKVVQEVAKLSKGPGGSVAVDQLGVAGVPGALRVQLKDEGGASLILPVTSSKRMLSSLD